MSLASQLAQHSADPGDAGQQPAPRRRRWLKRAFLAIAFLVVAVLVLGFFAVPPLARHVLTTRVAEELGRKISVGDIALNPLALTLEVRDLVIHEPGSDQRFVAFRRLFVDISTETFYRRAPVVAEATLEEPFVNVVMLAPGRFNFTDLVEKFAKDEKKDDPPARFSVNNIRLTGGAIDVDDRPHRTRHQVRALSVSVPFISNLPYHGHIYVQPALSARVNGTALELTGKSKPFSATRETSLDVSVKDLDLPYYLRYVPMALPYRIASARLDLDADIAFAQPEGKRPQISVKADAALKTLRITTPGDEALVAFERLAVRTHRIDVFGTAIGLASVRLEGADVNARRQGDGSLNLAVLRSTGASGGEVATAEPEPPAAKKSPTRVVTVDRIELAGARLRFQDAAVTPAFETTLSPIEATVDGLSTAPDAPPARVALTVRTDAAESLDVKGTVAAASGAVAIDASLSAVPIARYAPYYAPAIDFTIPGGVLSLGAHVEVTPGAEGAAVNVSAATLDVTSLSLRRSGSKDDFVTVPRLSVRDTALDLARRTVSLGDVAVDKLRVVARRAKNGVVDITRLTPEKKADPHAAPTRPETAPPAPSWTVTVGHALVDRASVQFHDDVPATPVTLTLSPTRIETSNLVVGAPGTTKVALTTVLNGKGTLDLDGTATLAPLGLDLRTRIGKLDVPLFAPYFADRLNVTLASARVDIDGKLGLQLPEGKPPKVSFDGKAGITKLAALDNRTGDDLLQWESLYVQGVRARTEPFSLGIREVALTDFRTRLQVNADGTLNLQGLVVSDTPAAGADAPPPEPPQKSMSKPSGSPVPRSIVIDQVTLQGGTILFSDRLIKPNVSATLTEVGGRVTGLLADAGTKADVDLRGKLSNQAPLEITGKINPLAGDLFADLKVSFRDIELPPFTPYSGKYAGYTIEKGKLTLDLRYLIDKRAITAENKAVIDQFTFGDKVESKDTLSLPVQLAVSLLKDRDGRINLDVPVTGSLDDPKFKLGRVIWQVIVNLVTKAVTAPFALIGNLLGGSGEALSYLDFAAGSASLDAAGEAKLAQLAKALADRPALGLEISGRVDPVKDLEGLRTMAFERKLKAQKFAALSRSGQPPASVDAVAYGPDEAEELLRLAYKAEKFPKPRNAIGLEKRLPPVEMEKLILTAIVVGPDDLRQLGLQRAQAVKEALSSRHGVSADRLFLVEPRAEESTAARSRAEFVLR